MDRNEDRNRDRRSAVAGLIDVCRPTADPTLWGHPSRAHRRYSTETPVGTGRDCASTVTKRAKGRRATSGAVVSSTRMVPVIGAIKAGQHPKECGLPLPFGPRRAAPRRGRDAVRLHRPPPRGIRETQVGSRQIRSGVASG